MREVGPPRACFTAVIDDDNGRVFTAVGKEGEGGRGRAQQSKKFLAPLSEIVGKLSSSRLLSLSSPLSPKAERQQTIPQLVAPAVLPFSRGGLLCVELSVLLISDS